MKVYTRLEHSSCLFIELSKVDANFLETDTVVHDRTRINKRHVSKGFQRCLWHWALIKFFLTNQVSDFKVKLNRVRGKP